METERHRDQMILLIESLKAFWGKDRQYFVSGNMFLHFDLYSAEKFRGPDFFWFLMLIVVKENHVSGMAGTDEISRCYYRTPL